MPVCSSLSSLLLLDSNLAICSWSQSLLHSWASWAPTGSSAWELSMPVCCIGCPLTNSGLISMLLSLGARPERLPVFDEECWQLMEACWDGDPSQRPLLGIVQPMLQGIMDRLCKSNSEEPNRELDDSTWKQRPFSFTLLSLSFPYLLAMGRSWQLFFKRAPRGTDACWVAWDFPRQRWLLDSAVQMTEHIQQFTDASSYFFSKWLSRTWVKGWRKQCSGLRTEKEVNVTIVHYVSKTSGALHWQ